MTTIGSILEENRNIIKNNKYGFIDKNNVVQLCGKDDLDWSLYKTLDPKHYKDYMIGVCYDTAHYLYINCSKELHPTLWFSSSKSVDDGIEYDYHAFITIEKYGSCVWLENMFRQVLGTHVYKSKQMFIKEYLNYWTYNHAKHIKDVSLIEYMIPKNFNMSRDEYFKHVHTTGKIINIDEY